MRLANFLIRGISWGLRQILSFCYYLKYVVYRIKYPHVQWGKHIRFTGFPIFHLYGNVFLGNELTFRSHTRYNMVGLNKPTSICVLPNARLQIGDYSGFSGVSIFCATSITIGKHCNFGGNSFIWDTDFHHVNHIDRRNNIDEHISTKPIVIGDDVFVGANTLVLKGVTIGDRSVIGAGSVVTKNIPADQMWAGNPAKFIRAIH